MTELKSNYDASRLGCDMRNIPDSEARRFRISYSEHDKIEVVASRNFEACLQPDLPLGPKERNTANRIWAAKAGSDESSDARSGGDYTTGGEDNTISGGGYIEGEVFD